MDSSATEAEQSLSIMIPMSSLCVDCASNLGFAVAFATPSSPPGEMSFYVCYPAPSSGSVSVDGQNFCFESGTKMRNKELDAFFDSRQQCMDCHSQFCESNISM